VKNADFEIWDGIVLLLKSLKDMTRCIDPVPFAWVDRVFFQADVSYILD
jgi:hypothetical protein